MEYTIIYMNIYEIADKCNRRLCKIVKEDKSEVKEDEIENINTDIIIINKDEEFYNIMYQDKKLTFQLNEILKNKINAANKNKYTKSFRCYIIDYEKIMQNMDYDEFCSRYLRKKEGDFMSNVNEITINIENVADENASYSDDDLYNINSWGADLSFRELLLMYDDDELLKPELQRKYVWTKNEASRFVDSILLGLPVPSIFLAKTSNEKRLIVDGYQRIMTVHDYVNGIFGGDGKVFKLSNSEIINKKWRGKSFLELTSDERTKIRTTTIHAIIFEQKHPNNDTGMYQIFERINTSGKILKPQEIRNCVYSGSFNTLLMNLNKEKIWRNILGSEKEDSRMADVELILRFFAISSIKDSEEINQSQVNLAKYLNKFMGNNKDINMEKCQELQELFIKIINVIFKQLGDKAFRNISIQKEKEKFTKKIHPVVFDAVSSAAAYAIKKNIDIEGTSDIESKYLKLLKDEKFKDAISVRTTNIDNIKTRINIATEYLYGVKYEW